MKKAAFIDHSFKEKSGSSQFFIEILQNDYEVDIYWDDSWKKLPGADLAAIGAMNYDLVVFFQVLNVDRNELEKHNIRNVVFVPMFDAARGKKKEAWEKLRPYKFINFCKSLHDQLTRHGFDSLYVQYYCPPDKDVVFERQEKLKGFFWQRYDWINWNHISALIKHAPFEKIHIHRAIDPPGFEFYPPSAEEMERYNITVSEWFDHRRDYVKVMKECHVFFTPRKFEGIGMSFIEAMAMGKCVVAPDFPTMNEYIRHGENGLLYNLDKLKSLDFDKVDEISKNAYESVRTGYEKWQQDQKEILKFCEATPRNALHGLHMKTFHLRKYMNRSHPKLSRFLLNIFKGLGMNF